MKRKQIVIKNDSLITLKDGFRMFLSHCDYKSLSESTIRSYKHYWSIYTRYLNVLNVINVCESKEEVLEGYVQFLKDNFTSKDVSRTSNIRHIRVYMTE